MKHYSLFLAFILASALTLRGQLPSNQSELSIKTIMQEPEEWIGSLPEDIYWSDRGDCIYFRWNPENEVKAPLYKVDTTSGNPVKVGLKKEMKLPSRSGDLNEARTRKVYVKNGNLFIHYIKEDSIQLLLNSKDNIGSPVFSKDEKSVIFVMDQCLYEIGRAHV